MANQGLTPSEQAALQQFENQRTHIAGAAEFLAEPVSFLGRSAPTGSASHRRPRWQSGSGTPAGDHDAAPTGATGSEALGPSLEQPVTVQDEAAFAFTAADQGVDINVAANLQNWLTTPVQTNRDVLRLVRSYHKQVIRPEVLQHRDSAGNCTQAHRRQGFPDKAGIGLDVGRQPLPAEAHGRTTTHHHRMASRCSPRATALPYWVDATADPGSDDFSASARSSPGPQLHDTVSECTVDGAHNGTTGHLLFYNDGALLQGVGHETGLYSEVWWRVWDTPLPCRGPANEGTPRQGGAEFPTVATKARISFASYSGSDEPPRTTTPTTRSSSSCGSL